MTRFLFSSWRRRCASLSAPRGVGRGQPEGRHANTPPPKQDKQGWGFRVAFSFRVRTFFCAPVSAPRERPYCRCHSPQTAPGPPRSSHKEHDRRPRRNKPLNYHNPETTSLKSVFLFPGFALPLHTCVDLVAAPARPWRQAYPAAATRPNITAAQKEMNPHKNYHNPQASQKIPAQGGCM